MKKGFAPYNFVPLPDEVVAIENIPPQNVYTNNTGYIDCLITTKSPLYTRCAMTPDFFREHGDKSFDKLSNDKKNERGQFFHLKEKNCPLIPGSSIRGMVRTLVEIAGYGKVQWVTDDTKITYRAVAAAKDDPLAEPYMNVLGKYGRNVQAGYLVNKQDEWYIQPAKKTSDLNLDGHTSFLKIKEKIITSNIISGFIGLNDEKYKPQYHKVSFDAIIQKSKRGLYNKVNIIGSLNAGHKYHGVLVCSGNMLETDSNNTSPRKNHALVLEKSNAKELKINKQAIINYKASLTAFQKKPPFDERMGCLKNGRPIFYVLNTTGKEVLYFGHSPNFRIPATFSEDKGITSPMDFVPKNIRSENLIDLAEAIFGYIDKMKDKPACAGRVFFTNAEIESAPDGIWMKQEPFTPKILTSPKPTAFQHYLVQNRIKGHDPDNKKTLAHYNSPSPVETMIRGCKMYWHKSNIGLDDIKESNKDNIEKSPTQYTRIRPVKAGVRFSFRIYFENLQKNELGALLWVLTLPGEDNKNYYHTLGMGKPFGMGAVKIETKLYTSNRDERYNQLFEDDDWAEAKTEVVDMQHFIEDFEDFILKAIGSDKTKLYDVERIKILLKMLEWPGPERKLTRYLNLEEYGNRNVLPDPLHVEQL